MKFRAVRKIAKNGNSYTVAIPRGMFLQMRLWRGIDIELVYDDDTELITLKAIDNEGRQRRRGQSANDMRPIL